MTHSSKITSSHLSRLAIVYLRQSSMAQVRQNTESTARQYGLATTAAELGWLAEQIVIVDADLGVSGRFGSERDGYREIVAKLCMGEVGAVFGLEVSRFGRSNADLTRLMELARLTDTLLVDADGVYDLANVNDRLLLGLKGQMSEIEMHFLLGRLHGAKRAAAHRGELRHPSTTTMARSSKIQTSWCASRSKTCSPSSSAPARQCKWFAHSTRLADCSRSVPGRGRGQGRSSGASSRIPGWRRR